MKKLITFLLIAISFTSFGQTIIATTPTDGGVVTLTNSLYVSATLDQTAYAVVFSIDPSGKTKVLNGKNKNLWAGVAFPSSRGNYMYYELTSILNGITPGEHTLRIDVYGANFRDLTDTREITFVML
jgi:hypothetical protein